ncbi:PepSY-associated TM helix domain-containing protein [Deinococcus pimensis]|uniref:PepSY-associated TM helix domain-containing protein n=1 Tax=Deinococcus pimensis TaxID=309888 RepID=UPI0004B166B5|nr:PepSY-associated TM helix domain-containing protein [Deinococcus pimensis]
MSSAERAEADLTAATRPARRPRTVRQRLNAWLRVTHVYTSMISLMVVLFFALTGITLNHPDLTFGDDGKRTQVEGALPASWRDGDKVNWLVVVEELRARYDLRGRASDERVDGDEASVSFHAPGYGADAFIDVKTGKYQLSVDAQGLVGVLNDFHRGRDAGAAWSWVIDLSGAFLTLVSLTGLALLVYLRKVRVKALAVMAAGTLAMIAIMHLAA